MSKFYIKLALITLVFVGLFSLINTNSVGAFALNPNPDTLPAQDRIPVSLRNDLENCNGDFRYSPAFWQWLSVGSDGQQSTAIVAYGSTAPITLRLHWASAVCTTPNTVPESRLFTIGGAVPVGTGSVDNLYARQLQLLNGSAVGDYRYASYTFNYYPQSAITSNYSVNITFDNRSINRFSNGSLICIALPRTSAPGWAYGNCSSETPTFTLNIVVDPNTIDVCPNIGGIQTVVPAGMVKDAAGNCVDPDRAPIGVVDSANCSVVVGWAFDPDVSGQSIDVHFYSGGTFIGAVTANGSRPDVNAAYGIGGNHGYSFTVPASLKSTSSTPTITAYAIGKSNTGANNGNNPVIGSGTIGPCKAASCNLIQGSTNGGAYSGNIGYDGVYQVEKGQSYSIRMTYQNTAPATGGYTWTTGQGSEQVDIGTDGLNGYSDYGNGVTDRRPPDGGSTTVAPGATESYTWAHDSSTDTVRDYRVRYQMVHENVEWFSSNVYGNGNCQFIIRVVLPRPIVRCVMDDVGTIEVSTLYTPTATIYHDGPIFAPNITNVGITFTVDGTSVGTAGGTGTTITNGDDSLVSSSGGYSSPVPSKLTVNGVVVYDAGTYGTIILPGGCPGVGGDPVTPDNSLLPYLKVFGADVLSGGVFKQGATCPAVTGGGIYAYAKKVGSLYQGASGQFGVTALLSITTDATIRGFYSSSNRTSGNAPPKGTTFSNTAGSVEYGGAFSAGACIPDYYTDTKSIVDNTQGNINAATASSRPSGPHQYKLNNMNGGGLVDIKRGYQTAVYIEGDVTIPNNIIYDTSARASVSDIPFFALIVLGNIYIEPNVTQLDGLFIAQPPVGQEATKGRIYTCAPSGVPPTASNLYSSCSNQLVINGGLIAQQVKFTRAFKSLKDSTSGEKPTNFSLGTGTNAAEVINFSPEMFIAPSPLRDKDSTSGPTSLTKYDAIYSLPPVF